MLGLILSDRSGLFIPLLKGKFPLDPTDTAHRVLSGHGCDHTHMPAPSPHWKAAPHTPGWQLAWEQEPWPVLSLHPALLPLPAQL